jgi:hypothetical protein
VTDALDAAVAAVNQSFVQGYPGEVARALEALPLDATLAFLEAQESAGAAAVVERLAPDAGELFLAHAPDALAAAVVARIDPARGGAIAPRRGSASGVNCSRPPARARSAS